MGNYLYKTVQECIASGEHLKSCDNDGYCNACGNQEADYGPAEEADEGVEDWVDRHSINCVCCGRLVDERFAFRIPSDEGMICATCKFEQH